MDNKKGSTTINLKRKYLTLNWILVAALTILAIFNILSNIETGIFWLIIILLFYVLFIINIIKRKSWVYQYLGIIVLISLLRSIINIKDLTTASIFVKILSGFLILLSIIIVWLSFYLWTKLFPDEFKKYGLTGRRFKEYLEGVGPVAKNIHRYAWMLLYVLMVIAFFVPFTVLGGEEVTFLGLLLKYKFISVAIFVIFVLNGLRTTIQNKPLQTLLNNSLIAVVAFGYFIFQMITNPNIPDVIPNRAGLFIIMLIPVLLFISAFLYIFLIASYYKFRKRKKR